MHSANYKKPNQGFVIFKLSKIELLFKKLKSNASWKKNAYKKMKQTNLKKIQSFFISDLIKIEINYMDLKVKYIRLTKFTY